MQALTLLRYEYTCDVLYTDPDTDEITDIGKISCITMPIDRMGFIWMLADKYYEQDRYRFYNFRNRQGEIIYPWPNQPQGRVLQIFHLDARLDVWGNVTGYSYIIQSVDQ